MSLLNGTGIHPLPVEDGLKLRVILVGIGGATCSGKTTLAKHLRNILPGSVIVHQDDFAPPQEKIPIHPQYEVQDWDDPEGAIDWTRMVNSLREVKATGKIPPEHYSHDHLNEQKDIPINSETSKRWRDTFHRIERERRQLGEQIIWVMVDGFLLYWDMDVVDTLDVRIFLRVPHDVLKQRRHERHGYHTAETKEILTSFLLPLPLYAIPPRLLISVLRLLTLFRSPSSSHLPFARHLLPGVQSDPEGALWRDPPHYWEQIVWPAYVKAHAGVLEGGDLEHGKSNGKVRGLIVVEGLEVSMSSLVDNVCERLVDVAERTQ